MTTKLRISARDGVGSTLADPTPPRATSKSETIRPSFFEREGSEMQQTVVKTTQKPEVIAPLKTVDRALDVLEFIASAEPTQHVAVKVVADALGLNLSSTYHIVNTLSGRHYLERDSQGNLRLGAKATELGESRRDAFDLVALAEPVLQELSELSGETVYLTELIDSRVIIRFAIESSRSLRVTSLPVGHSGSEDERASGIAVLAHLSNSDARRVIASAYPKLEKSEVDARVAELQEQFAETRKAGYFFESERYDAGVTCLAAPYFNAKGEVMGSISVSAPTIRVSNLLQGGQESLRRAVEKITLGLQK